MGHIALCADMGHIALWEELTVGHCVGGMCGIEELTVGHIVWDRGADCGTGIEELTVGHVWDRGADCGTHCIVWEELTVGHIALCGRS